METSSKNGKRDTASYTSRLHYARNRYWTTENEDTLKDRIERAKEELLYENKFDKVVVNDDLEKALLDAENIVKEFLNS